MAGGPTVAMLTEEVEKQGVHHLGGLQRPAPDPGRHGGDRRPLLDRGYRGTSTAGSSAAAWALPYCSHR